MDATKFAAMGRRQGQVLFEFQILLDYVTQVKPRIGKKTGQLSPTSLLELNKRLSKSLHLDLRKPQPRSFPHVNALFLLFKASGLASYTYEDTNLYIRLESSALKKWKELSDSDKYFHLLQAWFANGHPEIICEERSLAEANRTLFDFYFKTLKNGVAGTNIEVSKLEALRTEMGVYQVALLEMFNFVRVEDNNTQLSKQWNIKKVYASEWGNVILSLIEDVAKSNRYFSDTFPSKLNGMFKELFSDFKKELELPVAQSFDAGSFIFRVDADSFWKRIQIPVHFTGLDFCQCVAEAFDLDPDLPFTLKAKNKFGYFDNYLHPGISAATRNAEDYSVSNISPSPGTYLIFEHGQGSGGSFELFCEEYLPKPIVKERILETKPATIHAAVAAKK